MTADLNLRTRVGATVFDEVPCLAAVVDSGLRIVVANASFARTFGPREGELCYAVYRGCDQPCEDCPVQKAFEDGETHVNEEYEVICDGKTTSYSMRSVPIREPDGAIEYVLQLGLDTTGQRELEEELRKTERLASVGLTTAGLAHTIKSMLGGLEGGIYVVDSSLEQGGIERMKSGWEMVRGYIDQISALVKNLLRYARPEQRELEPVEPGELVDHVVELFASKAALIHIDLQGRSEADLSAVQLEREVIRGCLANLVSNAIDACAWDPAEGKEHQIQVVSRSRPEGGVIFEVIDNGMGISAENQRKTLTSHFTTKGIRGTGLGLLLTKKAVQEHGGSITFTSTPGEGTAFCIELPVQPSSA